MFLIVMLDYFKLVAVMVLLAIVSQGMIGIN